MNMVDELDIIADAFGVQLLSKLLSWLELRPHSKLRDLFKAFNFKRTGR
ncbi:MAG: hypothetical protein ACLRQF_02115 [Thomasclavelia ramosa]